MNPKVLRRFIVYLAVATFVLFTLWAVVKDIFVQPSGDYEVRQGDILLTDGKHDEALAAFDEALSKTPNHRGALMGRALVFMKSGRQTEALAELTHLIGYLQSSLKPDVDGRKLGSGEDRVEVLPGRHTISARVIVSNGEDMTVVTNPMVLHLDAQAGHTYELFGEAAGGGWFSAPTEFGIWIKDKDSNTLVTSVGLDPQ